MRDRFLEYLGSTTRNLHDNNKTPHFLVIAEEHEISLIGINNKVKVRQH